jgi:hypothetical protein
MPRRITPTYILLNQITLAADSASVTFSNIPQNYGDLVLVMNVNQAGGTSSMGGSMRLNGDTGSNYSWVVMTGNGSSASSGSGADTEFRDMYFFESVIGAHIFQIMDYSATDKHKTLLARANVASFLTRASAGRWANTAAVNSISAYPQTGFGRTFASGSTFSLYGIVA